MTSTSGLALLQGQGDAGGQAAAPHRHHHRVHLRQVLQDLQPQGALPGHNFGVVVGVNKDVTLGLQGPGLFHGLGDVLAVQNDLGPKALGSHLLGDGGPFGHDDGGRETQLRRGVGHPLGMVAGGGGHHPLPFAPLLQQGEAVQRPPELKGAGGLEVLQLEIDLPAADPAQGVGIDQRGVDYYPFNPLFGCFDVF